jgi:hypothetical protein
MAAGADVGGSYRYGGDTAYWYYLGTGIAVAVL